MSKDAFFRIALERVDVSATTGGLSSSPPGNRREGSGVATLLTHDRIASFWRMP
jgi:hypothetical protein